MELKQVVNRVYAPLFTEKVRYVILMGGRGAGRSTVASQFALAKLVSYAEYFRCAIMRFILGDVRSSIYLEIVDRVDENNVREAVSVIDNSMTIKHGRNIINAKGFRKSSGDQKAKLKSIANYNCVIIEEADEIPEADFMQLDDSLRTMKGDITIILLLNPPARNHWIIQRFFDLVPHPEAKGFYIPVLKPALKGMVTFIHTTYLDNVKNIAAQVATSYEAYRDSKPLHYWNMVRGLVPETVRGKIFTDWRVIDELPHEARLEGYGLDFGYHPDPSVILALYYHNGGYILDEVVYQQELQNRHLSRRFENLPKALVAADSAEPKSIAELKELGVDIVGVEKGKDSVRFGLKRMQGMRISVTRRSVNLIREADNLCWLIDKDGNEYEEPDPACDDHAIDAARYAFSMVKESDPMKDLAEQREREARRRERLSNTQADSGL